MVSKYLKTCLIIVDALRYDQVPHDLLPPGFAVRRCKALSDTTEPSLATILSGLPPEEHGILQTGQRDACEKLKKLDFIPKHFDKSFIASPAMILFPHFTYSTCAKYSEEVFVEARRYTESVDFMLLHLMDCHDMRPTPGRALKFYHGFEPVPEHVLKWKPRSGLSRPFEDDLRYTKDAGWLKAKYRASVAGVFESMNIFLRSVIPGWKVVITADHGESFVFWHHDGVPDDSVFQVPLITNLQLKDREYSHLDIFNLCFGERIERVK